MSTVIEIIEAHLRAIGADGLVSEGECGCELGDIAPCLSGPGQCSPGYRGAPGADGGNWAMYTSREAADESLAEKCQRVMADGEPCGLQPGCPDCGRCLVDVGIGA